MTTYALHAAIWYVALQQSGFSDGSVSVCRHEALTSRPRFNEVNVEAAGFTQKYDECTESHVISSYNRQVCKRGLNDVWSRPPSELLSNTIDLFPEEETAHKSPSLRSWLHASCLPQLAAGGSETS